MVISMEDDEDDHLVNNRNVEEDGGGTVGYLNKDRIHRYENCAVDPKSTTIEGNPQLKSYLIRSTIFFKCHVAFC